MIAFTAARHYRAQPATGQAALLNVEDGGWRFNLPRVTRCPDPLTFGATPAYAVSLLRVGFLRRAPSQTR